MAAPEISPFATFVASIGTAILTSIAAPYVHRWWKRNDDREAESSTVKVAELAASDKFQDRLMKRIEELEERMSVADKEREEKVAEYANLKNELMRLEKIASDLRVANENLDSENSSLKTIILELNTEVVNLRTSIQGLRSQLIILSCEKTDCPNRRVFSVVK